MKKDVFGDEVFDGECDEQDGNEYGHAASKDKSD